jgi:hypothetical protein
MTSDVRDHRHTERRHMIRATNALVAGLDQAPPDPAFLLACADYLGWVVGRFVGQGRANLARLRPRVAAARDEDGARIVADIAVTLDRTETALRDLLDAAASCRTGESGGLAELLAAGRRFVLFYNAVLASRKDPAQQVIDRHFGSAEYWALTDDVTPVSVATEADLYARIGRLAPPGVAVEP